MDYIIIIFKQEVSGNNFICTPSVYTFDNKFHRQETYLLANIFLVGGLHDAKIGYASICNVSYAKINTKQRTSYFPTHSTAPVYTDLLSSYPPQTGLSLTLSPQSSGLHQQMAETASLCAVNVQAVPQSVHRPS